MPLKRKSKTKRKNSVKVKGRTAQSVNRIQTVYNGFNNTPKSSKKSVKVKYGFDNSSLKSSAEIASLVRARKNASPIIRFVDDLIAVFENARIDLNLADILVKFVNSVKEKLPREKLSHEELQEYRARVIIHLNNFVIFLNKHTEYTKKDIDTVNSLIKSQTKKHKLNLNDIKGRVSFSNRELNVKSVSNSNSNNW